MPGISTMTSHQCNSRSEQLVLLSQIEYMVEPQPKALNPLEKVRQCMAPCCIERKAKRHKWYNRLDINSHRSEHSRQSRLQGVLLHTSGLPRRWLGHEGPM